MCIIIQLYFQAVQSYGRAEATARLAQATADQDEDSTVQTDNETTASVSSSLKWQDDPEFQQKLRYENIQYFQSLQYIYICTSNDQDNGFEFFYMLTFLFIQKA